MFKTTWEKERTDVNTTNMWLKKGKLPSHTEGFLFAVQEQEIDTKALETAKGERPECKQKYGEPMQDVW